MQSFESLIPQIEEHITQVLSTYNSPNELYEPCRYLIHLGGKRVRPVLCLMAHELFQPLNNEIWNAATAIELFHNFTLVHDDIMDKAPLRRGRQTIHEKFGLTAGILSGDAICIMAYEQLAHITSPSFKNVLQRFNKTALEVCEGQQLDMNYEKVASITEDEYMKMILLKTSVLLGTALQIGAWMGGATTGAALRLYHFGIALGLSFQLKDDYLDAFGDPERLGKQNGGDIVANKKTLLLVYALQNANPIQKEKIMKLLGSHAEDKVAEMKGLYEETGARAYVASKIKQYSDSALTGLEDVPVVGYRKEALKQLAEYLLHRDK